ncbi:MAG: hypothetical protein V4655_06170 [Bdellovibrionota bacterium]
MLKKIPYSLVFCLALGCGKDSKKSNAPVSLDQTSLSANVKPFSIAGIYQQVANGIARLEISDLNVITGTTLTIPSLSGDGTRLTPQFPQQLLFDEVEGYFATLGTINDNTSVFKNIELRIRPYSANTQLDVTLVYPPTASLPAICRANKTGEVTPHDGKGKGTTPEPTPNPLPTCPLETDPSQGKTEPGQSSSTNPGQSGSDNCECPTQTFYVYRFQRI